MAADKLTLKSASWAKVVNIALHIIYGIGQQDGYRSIQIRLQRYRMMLARS